ncbi:MAG: hypothetical protein ABII12_09065 [Planctomycetota bacterium]
MNMRTRGRRRLSKIVVQAAVVPILLMTAGCDPAINNAAAQGMFNFVGGISSGFITSLLGVVQQSFPSADILQALLGGGSAPYFTG